MPTKGALTAKERVLAKYPKAHTYTASVTVVILKEPIKVQPRGQEQGGSILGTGSTYKRAWANAANNLRHCVCPSRES